MTLYEGSWSGLCCIWQLPRDTNNKRLCTQKQKCTNINIVDADTCTLDIAKLLKISFYPIREQEEQAILPKPIVTCPPYDGPHFEVRHAEDDADLLIVQTAMKLSQTCNARAYIVAIQIYWFYWSTTVDYHPSQHHIIWEMWLKSSTACWDLRRLWEAIKDEEFSQRFLALHALSGSDTTSRTYLKGTMNYLKVGSQRRYQLLECCGHFLR